MTRETRLSVTIGSLLLGVLLPVMATAGTKTGDPAAKGVLKLDGESGFLRLADSTSLHSFEKAITI
ncbi:MAG: hypothetical protein ABFE01_03510, partial [Phycisphaerales bacterium]